jgi:hypothetical protein
MIPSMKSLKPLLLALATGLAFTSPGLAGETKDANSACCDSCKQCCCSHKCTDKCSDKCHEKPASKDTESKVEKK